MKDVITVEEVLNFLIHNLLTGKITGQSTMILSLTGSGIEDANINDMAVEEGPYVEVRCKHPSLQDEA